ncbi:arylamine N-acetyltransferase [Pseudonocardia eucalypti]|uniref:Arylamine N-acetyltransferase n=1 Tax=Pseudonocardia eucalypti TaxID=648755 RepID=A0ABP9QTN0_9PSEU|nr:N-hydroxyarylamine O-acetyltransferase [Pseudonocardia eucalypti]
MSSATSTRAGTEWEIDQVDLDAYLARIGHHRVPPTLAALHGLTRAHTLAIPFENVDVVLGTHRGLGLREITDKMVHRRRGGYCFEHALLFAAVAEQLGYRVRRLMARVQPRRAGGPRTHMVLAVTPTDTDGLPHLVDIGFGAGMIAPMPLRDGALVDQAGWPHQLARTADGLWTLAKLDDGDWQVMHEFDETEQRLIDYEVAHHYTSTHPHSPFVGRLVVMRLADGVVRRMVGDQLTVEHADGRAERTPVSLERLGEVLRELGVQLDPAELAELRARVGCS